MSTGVPARSTVCSRPPMRSRASSTTAGGCRPDAASMRRPAARFRRRRPPRARLARRSCSSGHCCAMPQKRRHPIAVLSGTGQSSDAPATTTKPDTRPSKETRERERFRTNAVRRRATHWRPHRHPTCRPGRPRAAPPNAPGADHSAPHPRHAPHVVELRTSHHLLTQRPRPTHFDAHRVSHSYNANTSPPRADPVANANAYRLGRTQNPMPVRVMKYRP